MKSNSSLLPKVPYSVVLIVNLLLLCSLALLQPLHAELLSIDKRGGLARAYLHPDKTPDLIEVYLLIESGGFDDGEGPEGLAHYLEHLVWLNATSPDSRGSTARHDDAKISGGQTIYSMKGPPERLDSYLKTMAKVFEPPSLDETFMLEERDIVRREYDYRIAEARTYPIVRRLVHQLFGNAPRARSVIGTPDSIARLTPKAALDLHARTHVPANAVLFIIGNTDLATASSLVEKHFGGIPAGIAPPRRTSPPFQQRRKIFETSVKDFSYRQLIYFKRIRLDTPIAEDQLDLHLDLLQAILDSTLEGSIAKPLRYDDFIARRYDLAFSAIEPGEVLMTFEAAPDEGIDLPELLTAFEDTLSTLAQDGVPQSTFDRVRKKRLSALEEVKGRRGSAIRLVFDQVGNEAEPISPKTYLKRYGRTTLDQVNDILRALAGPGDVAAALVSPDPSD